MRRLLCVPHFSKLHLYVHFFNIKTNIKKHFIVVLVFLKESLITNLNASPKFFSNQENKYMFLPVRRYERFLPLLTYTLEKHLR